MTSGAIIAPIRGARQKSLQVQAFVNDQESEGVVRQAIADLAIETASIMAGDVTTATALLSKQPSPRLLIVDISGARDQLTSILELAEVCEPGVGVVAIGDSNDISLYRQLKNAGVAEYFFKPLIRDQLSRTCSDVLNDRLDQPSLFSGKLVFMLGVRGGVGTTTLATSAAWHMSEMRQRWTMLLDLDLQGGDAALLFDVAAGQALREAFERPDRVDKLFLERGSIHVNNRLNLLASLEPLGSTVEGSEDALRNLLELLLRRYRLVIVDIPAAIAVHLPQIIQMPSTCALVGSASLASARDMGRWREHIGPNTQERRTLQVLNRISSHGGLSDAEFARACGKAPDVVIQHDRELAASANLGVREMRKCALFRSGVTHVLQEITGEPMEKPASLFKRIFRA
jgi:pilus assembly protein CpaE